MSLKIGIVGMPNVGKSTLFNALTRSQKAEAANFPFCTIDPNIGIVEVPDKRLQKIAQIAKPQKIIHSSIEFVDIAGLVAGASQGEGLGNKFLSHIRECQAIAHVVRHFENDDIHHVNGTPDPLNDLSTIMTELMLADLESVNKQYEKWSQKARTRDKEATKNVELLGKFKSSLENEKMAKDVELNNEEEILSKTFGLLTQKPFLIVANIAEENLKTFDKNEFSKTLNLNSDVPIIPICAQIENELGSLPPEESKEYLNSLGVENSGLENFIQESFDILSLHNYFTAGEKEVRSWTIKKGDTAPMAAGVIHTDFEKKFIKADIIGYEDFITYQGESGAKEAGKMRLEGKDYQVQNGDIIHFKCGQ